MLRAAFTKLVPLIAGCSSYVTPAIVRHLELCIQWYYGKSTVLTSNEL